MTGFGWSFYGFFIAAAVWMVVYFIWAFAAARVDKPQGLSPQPEAGRLSPQPSNDERPQ
jgi:hypothetical protein